MMKANPIYFKRRDYLSKEARREGVPARSCYPEVRVSAWGPAYRPSRFHPGWRDWSNGTSSVLCCSRLLRRRRKRSGLGCADLQAKAGTAPWRGSAATGPRWCCYRKNRRMLGSRCVLPAAGMSWPQLLMLT